MICIRFLPEAVHIPPPDISTPPEYLEAFCEYFTLLLILHNMKTQNEDLLPRNDIQVITSTPLHGALHISMNGLLHEVNFDLYKCDTKILTWTLF